MFTFLIYLQVGKTMKINYLTAEIIGSEFHQGGILYQFLHLNPH